MSNSLYDWPDYYDWTSTGLDGDVTYYVELAKQSRGPVLELGCGTGRISLAIAKHGIPVTGVDLSASMLDRARRKAEEMNLDSHIRWVQADMTRFEIEEQFPLILIPYRSFLHLLTVRDQISTLRQVQKHLRDDGLFSCDIFVPQPRHMIEMDGKLSFRGSFPIPGTRDLVELYDYTEYDHFNQMAHVVRYAERFDGEGRSMERVRSNFSLRYIYPTELNHLLTLCGFKVIQWYGSFHRGPFDHRSEELIIEAVKRQV